MTIKAIIFDVDGTLADTEDGHRKSFNKAFAESGLDWNWDVALYDKLLKVTGGKERIKYFVERFSAGLHQARRLRRLRQKSARGEDRGITPTMLREGHIPLRPGIKQLIHDAHAAGITLAIATTTTPENVSALLEVGLGKDWAELFCRQRLRRHRAAQEARAGYLLLGAGQTGLVRRRLHRAGRLRERPAFQPRGRDQDLTSPPTTTPATRISPVRQAYSTT